MYRQFPGANLSISDNLAGKQAGWDDQSNSFLHKDANDHWNRISLNFTDEQQEQQRCEKGTETKSPESSHDYNDGISTEQVTSPPLSSFSVLSKDGDGFCLNFGSLPKENMYQHHADVLDNEHATALNDRAMQDAMELVSFKLGQQEESSVLGMPKDTGDIPVCQPEAAITLPSLHCPSISSSDDDDMFPIGEASMINSREYLENDRGFRKKSREKIRRREMNIKFEMLVNVLGLAGRVRKKNILHEAASAVMSLRRECNQLRHDRDRLQQQLVNLATYLQNSERGPAHLAS